MTLSKVNAFCPTLYISKYQIVLTNWINSAFPYRCAVCRTPLRKSEEAVCDLCTDDLPEWPRDHDPQEFALSIFGGRIPVERLVVRSPFHAGSSIQAALHAIKYKGARRLAERLGHSLADRWSDFILPDSVIIPVPLHPRKREKRGYNQSEEIGRGLAEKLSIPMAPLLRRDVDTPTQTKLDRTHRWANVSSVFDFNPVEGQYRRPVLLLDDTLTTGATLEACGQVLLKVGFGPLQVTTLAYAP